ncbi:hypothetical protein FKM82_010228 [Ascaphus truei]
MIGCGLRMRHWAHDRQQGEPSSVRLQSGAAIPPTLCPIASSVS